MTVLARADWDDSLKTGPNRNSRLQREKLAWETTFVSFPHPYSRWSAGLLTCLLDSEKGIAEALLVRDAWQDQFNKLTSEEVAKRLKS